SGNSHWKKGASPRERLITRATPDTSSSVAGRAAAMTIEFMHLLSDMLFRTMLSHRESRQRGGMRGGCHTVDGLTEHVGAHPGMHRAGGCGHRVDRPGRTVLGDRQNR